MLVHIYHSNIFDDVSLLACFKYKTVIIIFVNIFIKLLFKTFPSMNQVGESLYLFET